jgi:hypothetical protein
MRLILNLMLATGRSVAEALIIAGSASCVHLIPSTQTGHQPAATDGALTPDEAKEWDDLVARLAA